MTFSWSSLNTSPPWSVEETDACFIVGDANGQALAYVYFADEPGRRAAAKLLTRDEARRIAANTAKLPEKQSTPQAVIDEHFDGLTKCDWNRIMAQYPAHYQLNLPDGVVIKGREEAAKLFANFVKPHDKGGLCGMKFTPEQTFVVGETLNIQWKAEVDFLAEPYKGSDAYETHNGLMVAMVSTFKGADLKMKSEGLIDRDQIVASEPTVLKLAQRR
jgi:hypothetical protein